MVAMGVVAMGVAWIAKLESILWVVTQASLSFFCEQIDGGDAAAGGQGTFNSGYRT